MYPRAYTRLTRDYRLEYTGSIDSKSTEARRIGDIDRWISINISVR